MFKFLSSLSIKFVKLPSLEILKIRLSKALSILTGVVLILRVWIRRPLDVSSNLHFSKILTSSCGSCPVGSSVLVDLQWIPHSVSTCLLNWQLQTGCSISGMPPAVSGWRGWQFPFVCRTCWSLCILWFAFCQKNMSLVVIKPTLISMWLLFFWLISSLCHCVKVFNPQYRIFPFYNWGFSCYSFKS